MSRVPFQLLQLSLISALDLALPNKNLPKNKNIKAYAVVWIDPERKLRTRPDSKGNNNPHWNQKFVFRVEDELMDSDTASVKVEIYAVGWLKDSLLGSVAVLIRDLVPPAARLEKRLVALQVRRHHSGRPQGILSMGVALLDNTMKSMPLCPVLTGAAAVDFCGGEKCGNGDRKLVRTLSDQTDLSRLPGEKKRKRGGSVCEGGGGSVVNQEFCGGGGKCGSVVNGGGGGGSMLNGSAISDLGPSPSVVAIAIAHGLYPLQQRAAPANPNSSVLEDWTVQEEPSVEDVATKLEQWRLDQGYQRLDNGKKRQRKNSHRRSNTVGGGDEGRLSCFGKVCGCEFTLVYGNKRGRKNGNLSDSDL